jgi:DNA-directed RNA polymerase I, II, and III subunit RPABC2
MSAKKIENVFEEEDIVSDDDTESDVESVIADLEEEEEEEEEDEEEEDEENEFSKMKADMQTVQNIDMMDLETEDYNDEDTEEEEDEEDEDEKYLQKFNEHLQTDLLERMHPEINHCNYDEMIALTRVVRDAKGRIVDPLHKTLPFVTKYEKAHIIGARAEQLDRDAEAFVPVDSKIITGRAIAIREFEERKIPYILARPLPDGSVEYWNLKDLEIIHE